MTKQITIDPAQMRARAVLQAPEIPINCYEPDPVAEARKYGSENLVRMYRDMFAIRRFETMLDRIKKEGSYEGIEYNHRGPAHLSMGQEAAAVGQAYHLTPDDFIFGSHRSHGEILAKSFSAIARLDEVRSEIGRAIFGQERVVDETLVTLLSGGHALLVGVPGLAKTRLAETLGVATE